MDTKIANPKIAAMVALDPYALRYNVELTPAQAIEFAQACGDGQLEAMIKEINEAMPLMNYGSDNPNTGKPAFRYRIGREYSRVVYIEQVKTYFSNFNWDILDMKIKEIAAKYEPDELDSQHEPLTFSIRIWWD